MEEKIEFILVFTPYAQYHNLAYYAYDKNVYGDLSFGTPVVTSLGLGIIVDKNIDENKLPNIDIYTIDGLATERQKKKIEKDWWNTIIFIHKQLLKENQ